MSHTSDAISERDLYIAEDDDLEPDDDDFGDDDEIIEEDEDLDDDEDGTELDLVSTSWAVRRADITPQGRAGRGNSAARRVGTRRRAAL